MPKAQPVSLHPLSFDDAIKALIRVDPERVGLTTKKPNEPMQRTTKPKHKKP